MENQTPLFSVSDFIALTNQTLEYAYPSVEIEGEVASFKVNQGKFVFFDLKDSGGSIGCFMMVFALRVPVEDGMKVIIRATPKLTNWGKFSLTVQQIRPSGEGSLKKSFQLLKAKLETEGLFSEERKRPLPVLPSRVAVISSTQAAGYADFIKIIDDRWGNLDVRVAHVQVQGEVAPDQIIRALDYLNQQEELPEVIVLIRGGGSADDLSAFNDELLVRAIAASRVPVLTGIGHEIDETLADLVADVRASTPTNAATILVPDKHEVVRGIHVSLLHTIRQVERSLERIREVNDEAIAQVFDTIENGFQRTHERFNQTHARLQAFNPKHVLERGYAIMRGKMTIGAVVDIETAKQLITAEVKDVKTK